MEALTTMAISAFLLVALASVVALMLRASGHAEKSSTDIEQTSRLLATLMRDIEDIAPMRWAGDGADFVFAGGDRSLIFAREAALPQGASESRLVILESNGRQMVEEERILPAGAQGLADVAATGTPQVLGTRFDVRFAYYQRLDTGEEALTDTWTTAGLLPVAIRISLFDRDGTLHGAVRVPLRVDAEPGCAAPRRGVCSFVRKGEAPDEQEFVIDKPTDPDDPLGWQRYVTP